MKVSIRRHGIVIKSFEIKGDKAGIGSGEECEIRLDDPYLAGHVGDFVRRGSEWHIVDPATSMEGITRDGSRVDDEPVAFGSVYSVGGFELVPEGERAATPRTMAGDAPVTPRTVFEGQVPSTPGGVPKTVFEAPMPAAGKNTGVPKTVFEAPMPRGGDAPGGVPKTVYEAPFPQAAQPAPQRPAPAGDLQFRPADSFHAPAAAAAPAAGGARRKRLLMIGGLAVVLLILLLIVATQKKGGAPEAASKTETSATATATAVSNTAPPSTGSRPLPTAEALAANLRIDEAMLAWQLRLEKGPDPALQQKYADAALEIGMVHAAASDSKGARDYFERAVKYGPPDSASVRAAKQRLESMAR